MKLLRNELRTVCMKCKEQTRELRDIEMDTRTELYPSIGDISLWIETLFDLVNEDYEGRILLLSVVTLADTKLISDLFTTWSDGSTINDYKHGKYTRYLVNRLLLIMLLCTSAS